MDSLKQHEQLLKALQVIVLTKHIHEYLALHDPKALEQAMQAINAVEANLSGNDFFTSERTGRPDEESNKRLAAAEVKAKELGYYYEWENDDDHDPSKGPYEKTCEYCCMYDMDCNMVESLCCIDDADDDYRRLVQAQLALQYFADDIEI